MAHRIEAGAVALGLIGVLALAPAQAAEPQVARTPAASVSEAQAMRVIRDPETGKLRLPTPAEAAQQDAQARAERRTKGLPEEEPATPVKVRKHANGMISATLGPEHMVTLRARRDANGKIVMSHDDPAHEHFVPSKQYPTE